MHSVSDPQEGAVCQTWTPVATKVRGHVRFILKLEFLEFFQYLYKYSELMMNWMNLLT